jgi:hypothetical protein
MGSGPSWGNDRSDQRARWRLAVEVGQAGHEPDSRTGHRGAVVGVVTAASPLAFWWLDPSTVYALGLALIAAVYIGFAVADGRQSLWLIVVGLVGHGLRDLVAAPPPVCGQHPVVAAVLHSRSGRCAKEQRGATS